MSTVTLSASTSREKGSRNARRLRTTGSIPAVIYGHDVSSLPISVNAKAFRTAMSGEQGLNSLIDLDADGKKFLVMAREIQRHPVRGTVHHVDFQVVNRSQGVEVEVPLQVIGDAVEVRHHDWEVDQQLFSIHVKAQPDRIPNSITVDISELQVGGAIRISDLELPDGVEATQDPQTTVIGTHAARVAATVAKTEDEVVAEAPVDET